MWRAFSEHSCWTFFKDPGGSFCNMLDVIQTKDVVIFLCNTLNDGIQTKDDVHYC